MRIGIIGCGKVGGTLGRRWAQKGHDVIFGSRHPGSEDMQKLQADAGLHSCVVSVKEAAAAGDVVVLAVPWAAAQETIKEIGNLEGRVVIDVMNPFARGVHGLPVGLAVDPSTSAAEQVAKWAQGARVVKAFNHMSFLVMDDPMFQGRPEAQQEMQAAEQGGGQSPETSNEQSGPMPPPNQSQEQAGAGMPQEAMNG